MPNTLTYTPVRPISSSGHPPRDRRLVSWVGRHGAVSIAHVMAALGLGQSAAYARVAGLIEAGLLERLDLLRGEPTLIRATRAGLRYAHLGGMAPAVVSPGAVGHWLRCATVALELEVRHGAHRLLTERELLLAERHEGRPVASAKVGELPNGSPRLHRPDFVILPEGHPLVRADELVPSLAAYARTREGGGEETGRDGRPLPEAGDVRVYGSAAHPRTREQGGEIAGDHERPPAEAEEMRACAKDARAPGGAGEMPAGVIAYEVELTAKSPRRLREIIRGWRRATWVAEVHYLCEPGQTRRAVERAVEKLHAADRIQVTEIPR